ncbi:MAG: carboxypeptidase regulatory-like domain-containing protein [Blastocatellia bacterium]|nr:carboxypeptidase regulatory-like domain-containing protein [Blastocatellia bacterium]
MRIYLVNLLSRSACLLFALTIICSAALAQFTSAIEGTVTDPNGAIVNKALVTIKSSSTGIERTVETSDSGYFRISSLPAAPFTITIKASGFKTTQKEITLEVAQVKTLNFALEVGAQTAEVIITTEAPQIESSQASVSNQIDKKRVADLPLVGRNFYTLVVLTPGVTGLPSGGGQAYAQATGDIFSAEYGVNLNGNGQRAESNGFLVDSANVGSTPRGGVTNVNPAADTVQELRVSVNNYSAEYGRNSSVLVNVLTKSGTNDFHGTLSWFHTNNKLQARTFTQTEVPVFRRNEASWTFGGPIIKNKTHFFAGMDILRSGVGAGFQANTVTTDFIDFMKQRFPKNISTFVMDKFRDQLQGGAVALTAGQVAKSDCTGSALITTPLGQMPCNFPMTKTGSFEQTLPRNGIQWNARVDHQFNDGNDRIYGNFYRTTNQLVTFGAPSVYPDFTTIQPQYTNYGNLSYTHIFSPTLLNEMAVGATRAYGEAPLAHGEIPLLNVPGIASYGTGFSDATFIQNNFEWRDMMSYNRGSHSFKFGFRYAKDDAWKGGAKFANVFTRPQFSFNNLFDFALDDPFEESNIGFNPKTGENKGVDFRPYFKSLGIFANDDWKIRPNLTITLGLRWEAFFAPGDYDNFFTRMEFQGGNSFQERIANAASVNKPPLNGTDLNNFAPRLGIAWDPTREGKMSIRAGVGVFYDRFAGQFFHDAQTFAPVFGLATARKDTPPVVPVYGLSASTQSPWQFPVIPNLQVGLDPKGGLLGVPDELSNADPNMKTQYSINWSLAVQYAFARDYVVEAAYIGSVGRKLYQEYDVNRVNGDLLDGRLDRLNPNFGVIGYAQANGNSSYHGATVSVKKRFTQGLDFQVSYTFGKAIDTSSSFGRGLNIYDPLRLYLNRGRADFDVRHKVASSIVYDIPKPKFLGRGLGKVFDGWQLAAITILQSGPPFSVTCSSSFQPVLDASGKVIGNNGCDFNADGRSGDPLNTPAFGNTKTGLSRSDYMFPNRIFQASDFPTPALGVLGNLGRNTFPSPGYANTDFTIAKKTKIPWFLGKEGANLIFRAEFFNLFNRVNLVPPVGDTSSPDFGRSTSAFGARNAQFGLKIEF